MSMPVSGTGGHYDHACEHLAAARRIERIAPRRDGPSPVVRPAPRFYASMKRSRFESSLWTDTGCRFCVVFSIHLIFDSIHLHTGHANIIAAPFERDSVPARDPNFWHQTRLLTTCWLLTRSLVTIETNGQNTRLPIKNHND